LKDQFWGGNCTPILRSTPPNFGGHRSCPLWFTDVSDSALEQRD